MSGVPHVVRPSGPVAGSGRLPLTVQIWGHQFSICKSENPSIDAGSRRSPFCNCLTHSALQTCNTGRKNKCPANG